MCKPSHLSTLVEEAFFLNETLSQIRAMGKLRPFPSMPVNLLFSKQNYGLSRKDALYWQQVQEHVTKSFSRQDVEVVKSDKSFEDLLFTRTSVIVENVNKIIKKWKNRPAHAY